MPWAGKSPRPQAWLYTLLSCPAPGRCLEYAGRDESLFMFLVWSLICLLKEGASGQMLQTSSRGPRKAGVRGQNLPDASCNHHRCCQSVLLSAHACLPCASGSPWGTRLALQSCSPAGRAPKMMPPGDRRAEGPEGWLHAGLTSDAQESFCSPSHWAGGAMAKGRARAPQREYIKEAWLFLAARELPLRNASFGL